jgi:phosphoribosylamine--glycine ligase
MVGRTRTTFETHPGYSVGVVLTVPSFPYSRGYADLGKGMPICFRDDLTSLDRESIHYGEVAFRNEQLVTSGTIGYIMVVTGLGDSVEQARRDVYGRVEKIVIPNCRYRNDIGVRFIEKDYATMQRLGWVD